MRTSASKVISADFNGDGFPDLFVAGRIIPGKYPETPKSHLLINDGKGNFTDVTEDYLPEKGKIGMIRDAYATDLNKDGFEDLIVVGEFTPIVFLENQDGKHLLDQSEKYLPNSPLGWWSKIEAGDFDNDGNIDFIVGNFGLNSQFQPSEQEILTLYYGDFDENSSIDPILTHYIQGKEYPFPSRDELLDQMYSMRSKFTDYESYSNASIEKILGKDVVKNASKLYANELRTVMLRNLGGNFEIVHLPIEAQFAPVYAIHVLDYDQDGNLDFVLAGNHSQLRLRLGVIDASFGQLFKGNGKNQFKYIPQPVSGLDIKGDVKSILSLPSQPKRLYFGINNQSIKIFDFQ